MNYTLLCSNIFLDFLVIKNRIYILVVGDINNPSFITPKSYRLEQHRYNNDFYKANAMVHVSTHCSKTTLNSVDFL